ncbi:MAG: glutamate formimidoyltransferase [Deltaproteobacteria bacterium]|nr:glutamate formimidoyltransferase [Deltaproteobacteria bacterium]
MKLVECVPNFSEGRDRRVIDAIGAAMAGVDGVKLLDVDPGAATNRTVYTLVGEAEQVAEAAFRGIRAATELIDMSRHSGEHPRQGACDVCPFIPLSGATMDDCVDLSRRLGKRVGDELGVPVFLYEYAATRPERRSLTAIRAGEYEALEAKLEDPAFAPDFGPARFVPRFGAMVTGAREFLIAYNINLNTRNAKIAKDIALEIRDSGRIARDDEGRKLSAEDGSAVRKPGKFDHCKATGWFIDEYRCAQVTMNLTNFRVTPVHMVFDEVCRLAQERGARVTGSEIVGLVPLDVLRMAGEHYLRRQGAGAGVATDRLIEVAVQSMGLKDVAPFDPARKVIEFQTRDRNSGLMGLTVNGFADELSSDSAAPGGGSVAALCGALSSGLSAMVAQLTFVKKGFEGVREEMDGLAVSAQLLKERFARAVDEDTDAFNQVMAAMRLPKKTDPEKAARSEALQAATLGAVMVPFRVLESCREAAELARAVVSRGNPNSLSDAGVASLCARLAAEGAWYNVLINLPGLEDKGKVAELSGRATELLSGVEAICDAVNAEVRQRLRAGIGS